MSNAKLLVPDGLPKLKVWGYSDDREEDRNGSQEDAMPETTNMRWRRFVGDQDDAQVTVETFETPIGQRCDPDHPATKLIATETVTRERAIELLRTAP